MYKARKAMACDSDYDSERTALTFDTVKDNQTSAPPTLTVHIAG